MRKDGVELVIGQLGVQAARLPHEPAPATADGSAAPPEDGADLDEPAGDPRRGVDAEAARYAVGLEREVSHARQSLDPSSRVRLKPTTARHFDGDTLFDRVARVVCEAGCLPRKELFESWEMARRTRRRFRGGRVVDLACGHGLVAFLMLLLDDTSEVALCADRRLPKSARELATALTRAWPRLEGRVTYVERAVEEIELTSNDVVVSTHACGALTDVVVARASAARARIAVLPCCHDEDTCDAGAIRGWVDVSLAIDVTRAQRLAACGYDVHTQLIPAAITPKNRLLLGEPARR